MTDDVVSIRGTHIRESEKAVLFDVQEVSGYPSDAGNHWFPLSQVVRQTYNPTSPVKGEDTMVITRWIATQKELV